MNTSFLKYAVIVVVSLGFGGVAGFYASGIHFVPQVVELTARAGSLQRETDNLNEQVKRLMQENQSLQAEQTSLLAELRDLQQRPAPQPTEQLTDAPAFDPIQTLENDAQPPATSDQPASPDNDPPEEDSRWTPAERAERVREFEQRVRARVGEVLEQEYASAPDRATQERIEVLNEYMEQMAQLREAMRDAETDEERDALRQTMRESFGNMRQIVQTQQDSMLRDLAATSGITDPAKQEAFVAGLRQLQASPFFQADQMMGGGGPPMGFGGWGGDRGGRGSRRR